MVKMSPVLHDWHMHVKHVDFWLHKWWQQLEEGTQINSRCYGTLFTCSKCANIRAVLILNLHRYYYNWKLRHIPDRHPHSNNISFAVEKKQTPIKLHYWIYKKIIYIIQKEWFDSKPWINHYSIFVEMETQIYVTREQTVAGKTHWIGPHRRSRWACVHWQKKKKTGKFLIIQNTPLSNQTCNTCGGKCISVRTQGMFAWGNLIIK